MKKASPLKTELIRKRWPKVRVIYPKGIRFFQVDARRKGTNGKQESFATRDEAMLRAATVESEFAGNGVEGLAMPAELRAMAFQGERILSPFGKTILQASEFFRDYLVRERETADSALVGTLADRWHAEKKAGKKRKLKSKTLAGIRQATELLKKHFPDVRIKGLEKTAAETFIFSLGGEYHQKENTRRLCSQFFIWCIDQKLADYNPFNKKQFHIHVPESDIQIFDSARATQVMQLCETKHTELTAYCAVSLFAGLRPGEAELLTWENIHLSERTIHVLGATSKAGETHNVTIEDNLCAWLESVRPKKSKGFICPQGMTMIRRKQALHADLGYRAARKNKEANEIPQDIMRHSYASHWLAKYGNRAQLAEFMANSVKVIRDYYKKVVSRAEVAAYWTILPRDAAAAIDAEGDSIRRQVFAVV